MLSTYEQSKGYELINPESSPMVEIWNTYGSADRDLVKEEFCFVFDYCTENGIPINDEMYSNTEAILVQAMEAKYGRS